MYKLEQDLKILSDHTLVLYNLHRHELNPPWNIIFISLLAFFEINTYTRTCATHCQPEHKNYTIPVLNSDNFEGRRRTL